MLDLKIESYFKLIFVISFVAIISAFFIEYILGHQPCNLCLIERIPYGLSLILIITNYATKINENFIILLLILIYIFSFTISVYHFGIEQGYFEESAVCGLKNAANIILKEEILIQLSKQTISCKDVTFRIFGLSLTSINIIISLIIIIMSIKAYTKYEKNKS